MGIEWTLCCRKLCCWGANEDDESPLLECLQTPECVYQVHDPGCIKSRPRNLEKNQTSTAKNLMPSFSSKNANAQHFQQPKNIDSRQRAEKHILHSSSECLKNQDDRSSNSSQHQVHRANNLDKSTGATKKIHAQKNKHKTESNNCKPGRNGALGLEYRQYYGETSRQGQQHLKAEACERTLGSLKCDSVTSTKATFVDARGKMSGRGKFQLSKSPIINKTKHSSGVEWGCSGDSNIVSQKLHTTRRDKKILIKKKTHQLSKSDGDVGEWFDDVAESKSITVSLTDFRTEMNCDHHQLKKSFALDSSVGCFLLKTSDIMTSTTQKFPEQEGTSKNAITKTLQATKTAANILPSSMKNLFDELYFGIVHFKVSYYHITKSLFVHIVDVKGMPPKGEKFFYNVVLLLSIFPTTKRTKHSATIRSSDMNPYFGESFAFIVKEPMDKVLKISAYDADFQGKYNALGHAMFQLKGATQNELLHSYRLLREPWAGSDPGQLEVTLLYNQVTDDMTVTVHRARGLTVFKGSTQREMQSKSLERYDSFAEVAQFCGDLELNVKRTCTVFNSRDPEYNSWFVFNLSSGSPHENFLVIRVILESLPKESELGRVIFGPLRFASELTPTPWGLAFSQNQAVNSWYKMYQLPVSLA